MAPGDSFLVAPKLYNRKSGMRLWRFHQSRLSWHRSLPTGPRLWRSFIHFAFFDSPNQVSRNQRPPRNAIKNNVQQHRDSLAGAAISLEPLISQHRRSSGAHNAGSVIPLAISWALGSAVHPACFLKATRHLWKRPLLFTSSCHAYHRDGSFLIGFSEVEAPQ